MTSRRITGEASASAIDSSLVTSICNQSLDIFLDFSNFDCKALCMSNVMPDIFRSETSYHIFSNVTKKSMNLSQKQEEILWI